MENPQCISVGRIDEEPGYIFIECRISKIAVFSFAESNAPVLVRVKFESRREQFETHDSATIEIIMRSFAEGDEVVVKKAPNAREILGFRKVDSIDYPEQ